MKNISMPRKQITLPLTKAGKQQYIELNQSAISALEKLRRLHPNAELVCPGAGYYNDHRRHFWNPVVQAAGIADFHWHDLRHTIWFTAGQGWCAHLHSVKTPSA